MTFLTKQEKYVAAFLIFGAICGLAYSYYKKFRPPINIRFRNTSKETAFSPAKSAALDNLLKEAKSVNINQASAFKLMKLNGIGPALANRIIEYRAVYGHFGSKDELKKVKGIGEKKFNAIKDYISVE